ncbi:uncharacterized protein LOC123227899 isoform X2 [Mangifera indica]|uniref:uncharacterized protein LOC123227899 isoform X2 n=1 Tax=Mangifera indica TaxID=29780 RepID=UPI001CF9319F|nr:uncharacterized protein LOC123227899 isoform X2 [Mangifera indica]
MATIDSLPFIDMSTLTQSELRTLSLCSTSVFDLSRLDDVVIPIIDRSLFNESAGSRKQTFSRPTTTAHHHHLRHRMAGLLPSSKQPPTSSSLPPHLDPEHLENRSILNFLRKSLSQSPHFYDVVSLFGVSGENDENFRKRKRERKPKTKVKSLEENLEIVNKNGKLVDIVGLGSLEDPFGEELRRRTEGMNGNEEELLRFMRDLGGQWCSRRKKRKIVDADLLGDILPVGWKLLLGLRRREGRASIYCRRYISPGGQHFLSCNEVSGYLQYYFELHDAIDHGTDDVQQDYRVASGSHAGATQMDNEQRHPNDQEKDVTLLGIENLAEVQIRDLFECHKCDMTFDEKDKYLQHLLSFHQRTTRRYRLGSSVGDGVIIKDGKFECQFCHKVFHERRRYNGHVGIHVRNYVRGIEDTPSRSTLQKRIGSFAMEEFPTRISKMDALIEIAQSSILETSSARSNAIPSGVFATDLPASISDHELNSDSAFSEPETDDGNMDKELCQPNNKPKISDEKMDAIDDVDFGNIMDVKIHSCMDFATALTNAEQNGYSSGNFSVKDGLSFIADEIDKSVTEQERSSVRCLLVPSSDLKAELVESNENLACSNSVEHKELNEGDNNNDIELQSGSGSKTGIFESSTLKDNLVQYGVSESSMSLMQPSGGLPTSNTISNKVEGEPCRADQRPDIATGFEELRLDEIEQLKFNFGTGQESLSLAEVPVQMVGNAGTEGSYSSSVRFDSEVLLDVARRHLTTCVWCGMEFSHEAVDSELQSDSVGYMCPTCKAKVSGQLSVLGSG